MSNLTHHVGRQGQGFIEYGRIAKTLHLLALADPIDDAYQRRQNRQLTIQESRHRLARKICHGNRGQIYQPYCLTARGKKTSLPRWA
jgi:TnpA family transposase